MGEVGEGRRHPARVSGAAGLDRNIERPGRRGQAGDVDDIFWRRQRLLSNLRICDFHTASNTC